MPIIVLALRPHIVHIYIDTAHRSIKDQSTNHVWSFQKRAVSTWFGNWSLYWRYWFSTGFMAKGRSPSQIYQQVEYKMFWTCCWQVIHWDRMWKCGNDATFHMCTCANVENMCNFRAFLSTNVDFYVMGSFSLSTAALLDHNQPIRLRDIDFALICALNFTWTSFLGFSDDIQGFEGSESKNNNK